MKRKIGGNARMGRENQGGWVGVISSPDSKSWRRLFLITEKLELQILPHDITLDIYLSNALHNNISICPIKPLNMPLLNEIKSRSLHVNRLL